MTALADPEFWARLLGIILIDISLAGDNALVVALAARELPPRQQLLGRIWGTVGAVGLRVAFIAVVSFLLRITLLQLAGGLSLPLVVWGSGLLANLMARHEWIVWLGGGVLGYVAGEMMANDRIVERWLGHAADTADQWLSIVLGVFVLGLGWWLGRSAAHRGRRLERA
jgi:predicted tellurium resistance membrane protein TerC